MYVVERFRVGGLGLEPAVELERKQPVVRGRPAGGRRERAGEARGECGFGDGAEGVCGPREDRREQEQCKGAEAASRTTKLQVWAAGSRGRWAARYAVGRLGRSLPEPKEGSGNVRCGP